MDYKQFKEVFKYGKPLKVGSYKLSLFVKNMLATYNDENKGTIKSMLKLFVNSSGLVTYIKDENLFNAIKKEDPELLEILLNPSGSTRFEDVDFVHEDKSLLQLSRELENKEIEKLLIDAGAKLTKAEEKSQAKAKIYSFSEDFSNRATSSFKEYDNQDSKWSFNTILKSYMLKIKNENKPYKRLLDFTNLLDKKQSYSLSVKVQRKAEDNDVEVGLVFDSNGKDMHIAVLRGNNILIYKRLNNNLSLIHI